MVKDITTIAFNSLEVEKSSNINNSNIYFSINTPPITIKNNAILKVSNFCHIGQASGHTDNMYLFRIRGVNVDTSKFFTGTGGYPLILTTTFNNNRSLYDENIISLVKQTINSIDIIVDTYTPQGTFNSGYSPNSCIITNAGTGYLIGQILTLTGGGGTDVQVEITDVSLGGINAVNVLTTPSKTYNTPPSLSSSINGSGAILVANITASPGAITSITITNGGFGYRVGQTLTITTTAGTGANISIASVNANGTILTFTLTSGGSGYTTAATRVVSVNPATITQTASIIPQMKFGSILNSSIPNSLNFSITFIIEEELNE